MGAGLVTAPPNLGLNTTPFYNDSNGQAVSGAQTFDQLDQCTKDAVHGLSSGEVVFAGPRDDGFYADLAGLFDMVDQRILFPSPDFPDTVGQQGGGSDHLAGFNVNMIGIQIPLETIDEVAADYTFNYLGQTYNATGVGVYATAERQRISVVRSDTEPFTTGPWIQIERMGNPLFSMAFLRLADKDRHNLGKPAGDLSFQNDFLQPELAVLINLRHSPAIGSLATTNRTDLAAIFVPDVLKIDTTTEPVPLPGQVGFNRLGAINGDLTAGKPSGWPNGRRLGDDMMDSVLTGLASGPAYSPVRPFGDNVNANDQLYHQVFPYAGTPHSGTDHR